MAQRYRSSRSGAGRASSRGPGRSGGRGNGRSDDQGRARNSGRNERGGRQSTGRGAYGPPTGTRGGAGPTVIAVAVVLVVLALVIWLASGSSDDKTPKETASPTQPVTTHHPESVTPVEPTKPPPPAISDALRTRARDLVEQAKRHAEDGEALYKEAMKAKSDGDDDLWQEKLEEASHYFYEIQDLWNEIIGEMPSNNYYDEEEVANHHLGRESDIVTRALSRLTDIKKQRRLNGD